MIDADGDDDDGQKRGGKGRRTRTRKWRRRRKNPGGVVKTRTHQLCSGGKKKIMSYHRYKAFLRSIDLDC